MKRAASIVFSFLLILAVSIPASAHPGRLDKNGGHNCSQASKDKGLCTGYHYHNGSGSSSNNGSGNSGSSGGSGSGDDSTGTGAITPPKKQPDGKLAVYFLDVGQGDSTYIHTAAGDDILIDGGKKDKGDEVVAYLKALGVKDIEVLIATHPDADHIGGLPAVFKAYDVKAVYAPKVSHTTDAFKDFLTAVKNEGRTIKSAKAGVSLPLNGVSASFVAPVGEYGNDLNDWSGVLRLVYEKNSFLFTGDAEQKSIQDMLYAKTTLTADVLKVSHHGAANGTTKAFLDAVKPKYAVISVGKNSYGHPTKETLDLLKDAKATIYRTDQQGTVTAVSDGKTITFVTVKK